MKDVLKGIVYIGLFAIPFIPLIVADQMFFPFITGKNFTFRIIVEIIFASWVVLALLDANYRPKFSWMAAGGLTLLVVMFFANLFGEYPLKSFWSNFERMDGYVTLVHFYLLFIVIGSSLKTQKMWNYLFHTSLAVALYVGFYGLAQQAGLVEGGRNRLDSTLGNAAYMAIYMLFHIFMLVLVMVRSKDWFYRGVYAILLVLFVYILLQTGTRGTFIGLIGGGTVAAGYLVLFSRSYPRVRSIAAGAIALVVLFVALVFQFQDSQFVQDSKPLRRIANISVEDLTVRSTIWNMALSGVEERPLLGWGQGNFNYVFNREYDPSLYAAEAWFDRVHNIVLDWLIAGGILGLLAYLSIFVGIVYYLLWRPFFSKKDDDVLSVGERAVLLGLFAAYFAHNLAVFDNIVSYMFFAIMLGYLHFNYAKDIPQIAEKKIDEKLVTNIAAPVLAVLTALVIYYVHVPAIQAGGDIIDAFIANNPQQRLEQFQEAIDRDSFAYQEIVEQVAQQGMNIVGNRDIPKEQRDEFAAFAEERLKELTERKPGDARIHVFFSSFYRTMGDFDKAREQAAIARELSPNKQAIMIEQGIIEFTTKNREAARDFFKEAYEADTSNDQARTLYAGSLFYTDEVEKVEEIITTDEQLHELAFSDFAFNGATQTRSNEWLIKMLETKIASQPNNAQHRASLAFVYYQNDNIDAAIDVLEKGIIDVPNFEPVASCYIENLRAGNSPAENCD